jgi:hypothetical protein
MAWIRVDRYNLGYNVLDRQFYFYYGLEGEQEPRQLFLSPEEFMALAHMFRNEGPVIFDPDGNYFVTAAEPVGEEEASRVSG